MFTGKTFHYFTDGKTISLGCPEDTGIRIICSTLLVTYGDNLYDPICHAEVNGDDLDKLKSNCDGERNCTVEMLLKLCQFKLNIERTDCQYITYSCEAGTVISY